MIRLRTAPAVIAALVAAGCAGGPARPEPAPPTPTAPAPAPAPALPTPAAPAPGPAGQLARLGNGITVLTREAPPGRMATLQFGIAAGHGMLAPGAAELAAAVICDGADPAQGRSSLRQAIAQLGGSLQFHVGPLSSWLDVRVPGARWRDALGALRDAVQSPTWSRPQIERVRDQLVAERTDALRRDPAAAMASLLLLGERSGTGYLLGLLDRDASEVNRFVAQAWQPGQALLALEVPADHATVLGELEARGRRSLGSWQPTPALQGPMPVLERNFARGLHWAPGHDEATRRQPCRIALLFTLTGPGQPGSADTFLLLSCLTMDGVGGRLEQLQREQGLGDVRWQSRIAQTPDASALVLTTTVMPDQVAALWRTVELARQSLRDVPPSPSELALALPRVPLLARLAALDDGSRLRTTTMQLLTGVDQATIDQRLVFLRQAKGLDLAPSVRDFLQAPYAMVVVGGEVPADLAAQRCEVLPTTTRTTTPPAGEAAPAPQAAGQPWLERACDAVGGRDALRRLTGWRTTARLVHAAAPDATETVVWNTSGDLTRTRTVLGQDIETTLRGNEATERLGSDTRPLDADAAATLRREQQRHPIALLAAFARGELTFRTIAQREIGDRSLVVVEAQGGPYDRLRLSIDATSHLVRTVEVVASQPDGNVLHIADHWQDYRTVRGLRVPMHRLSSLDDGQERVETVFTAWLPTLR